MIGHIITKEHLYVIMPQLAVLWTKSNAKQIVVVVVPVEGGTWYLFINVRCLTTKC